MKKYRKGTDFMCIFFFKKMNCYLVIMATILKWHFGIEWEVIYMTDAWNDPNLEEDLSCISIKLFMFQRINHSFLYRQRRQRF